MNNPILSTNEEGFPKPHERCSFCQTVIVYELMSGHHLRFTAHDEEFCKHAMLHLIQTQQAIIEEQGLRLAKDRWQFHRFLATISKERKDIIEHASYYLTGYDQGEHARAIIKRIKGE